MELHLDRQGTVPLTAQIVSRIEQLIDAGRLRPGQRLPSIRKLAAHHGISYHTAVTAYEQLVASGRISAQQGRGFFIDSHAQPRQPGMSSVASESESGPLGSFWRLFHGSPELMKLGCGWLPPAWRDTQVLARVIRRTANFSKSALVEYGDPLGYLPLRQQLCLHLQRKLSLILEPQQVLTTLGATHALDLLIRLLVAPGDHVLVDDPCNSNLVQLLKLRGAQVIGIPRRIDGPDLAVFAETLAKLPVKAFFINSMLHNPTGSSISASNAFQLLRLAHLHDLTIVEDDVYADFGNGHSNRLAMLDGLDRVIYVGSFSKTLSASLRVGYVAGPARLIARLADLKLLTMVAVPGFCERFVSIILGDGTYQRHLVTVQHKLRTHQAMALEAFRQWGWAAFCEPQGGMFVWVRHPQVANPEAFVQEGVEKGIVLVPGSAFSADGQPSPWFRINVAHFDATGASVLFKR